MITIIPAPAYVLAHAAWIPTLVIWHVFFFNDPATTEIYTHADTLSLHDALPTNALSPDGHVSPGTARAPVVASPRATCEARGCPMSEWC
jgi:hypothetical protein